MGFLTFSGKLATRDETTTPVLQFRGLGSDRAQIIPLFVHRPYSRTASRPPADPANPLRIAHTPDSRFAGDEGPTAQIISTPVGAHVTAQPSDKYSSRGRLPAKQV